MFESVENNRKMILGAYRKLKSYYYYDKTILYNKISLAMWESDSHSFENRVNRLAKFMCTLENEIDYNYVDDILIVIDKPCCNEMTVTSILHKTLVKCKIIEPKNLKEYIFDNAKDIRNANMFNNHLSSFPLISYVTEKLNENFSLISAKPQDVAALSKDQSEFVPLATRKIQLCPRFIHFDELYR